MSDKHDDDKTIVVIGLALIAIIALLLLLMVLL